MSAATGMDGDHAAVEPHNHPNLVVVNINGRVLGFRRSARPKPPPLPPRPPALPPVIRVDTANQRHGFRDRCRRLERRLRPWSFSAALQGLVVLVLAVAVISALRKDPAPTMEVRTIAMAEEASELQTFELSTDISSVDAVDLLAPQDLVAHAEMPTARWTARPASPFAADEFAPRMPPGAVGIAIGDLTGGGGQLWQEVKMPTVASAEFFGVRATGSSFVFVVDSSSSMRGSRWRRATRELVSAISGLSPEQSFYVIFFDGGPHPMFGKRLAQTPVKATPENVLRLRRWMRMIEFGSVTTPQTSVEFALALKPDAVFLLTDGEFQDRTMDVLRDDNHTLQDNGEIQYHTVFHTVGFQSGASQDLLMKIAEENGGTYRIVK